MVGKGTHPILGLSSPDPVLSMVAPIGLAASVGTGLVVDLAMSVPLGVDEAGLPSAFQVVAPLGGEELLLSLAAQVERAAPWELLAPGW